MTATHEIFLRAYIVCANQKKITKPKRDFRAKWPKLALVFDTETRITVDQSLTFGVYRCCEQADGIYKVTEEGIFYVDNLPAKEGKILQDHVHTAVSDVVSFPPRFPLYSRSEFMKRVFWPTIKYKGALVCGFNLPFDLARLALKWSTGEKDEWSLVLSEYADGSENLNRPRVTARKHSSNSQSRGCRKNGKTMATFRSSICAHSDGRSSVNRFRSRQHAWNSKPSIISLTMNRPAKSRLKKLNMPDKMYAAPWTCSTR